MPILTQPEVRLQTETVTSANYTPGEVLQEVAK